MFLLTVLPAFVVAFASYLPSRRLFAPLSIVAANVSSVTEFGIAGTAWGRHHGRLPRLFVTGQGPRVTKCCDLS